MGDTLPACSVQASIAANTYVVSGHADTKKLQELLPGIINQLGPDNLANLKKLAETYQGSAGGAPPPVTTVVRLTPVFAFADLFLLSRGALCFWPMQAAGGAD